MKKTLTFFAILLFVFTFAQEKRIDFTKEYEYDLVTKDKRNFNTSFRVLGNENSEFLSLVNVNSVPISFFSDNLGMSSVSIGLNNKLYNSYFGTMMFGYGFGLNDKKSEVTIEKSNTKETILGISCNHYLLTFDKANRYALEGFDEQNARDSLKVCIDEKNSINNISLLSGFLNYAGSAKLQNSGLKGLVLKVGPADKSGESITLKSVKDSKDFVYFNHRDAMMKQQKMMDSIALERKKIEDEYSKYEDSAYAEVDSAAAILDDDVFLIDKYVSAYKKNSDEPDYAINNIPNEKMWDILPKHCRNFENDVPELDNKEFRKHLSNYVGQMCDMYLTQSSSHNVGIKITLDEIRHEILYINENKEKLNKSDQRKVNKYLEKLD